MALLTDMKKRQEESEIVSCIGDVILQRVSSAGLQLLDFRNVEKFILQACPKHCQYTLRECLGGQFVTRWSPTNMASVSYPAKDLIPVRRLITDNRQQSSD